MKSANLADAPRIVAIQRKVGQFGATSSAVMRHSTSAVAKSRPAPSTFRASTYLLGPGSGPTAGTSSRRPTPSLHRAVVGSIPTAGSGKAKGAGLETGAFVFAGYGSAPIRCPVASLPNVSYPP